MARRTLFIALGPIALGLLMVSCSADHGPLPDAGDLRHRTTDAMAAVETAGFELTVSGASVYVGPTEMLSAEGVYVAPDSARAVLGMRVGVVSVDMATVSIGPRTWLTDPLSGRWNELDPGTGFNPAVVFGDEGWPALLRDLDNATVDHHDNGFLLEGTAPSATVRVLTSGIAGDDDVDIALVIDADTDRILEARFSTDGPDGVTDWVILLGPYDEPATVEPPTG